MNALRMTIAVAAMLGYCALAPAKLPPPTPEEEAKAAAAKEKAKADAEAAQEATKRAQDRVAQRYIAEMKARGIDVQPTPISEPTTAAVTTAPGKTPAESDTGEAPERKGKDKGGKSGGDATHTDAGKDSNKKN